MLMNPNGGGFVFNCLFCRMYATCDQIPAFPMHSIGLFGSFVSSSNHGLMTLGSSDGSVEYKGNSPEFTLAHEQIDRDLKGSYNPYDPACCSGCGSSYGDPYQYCELQPSKSSYCTPMCTAPTRLVDPVRFRGITRTHTSTNLCTFLNR